MGDNQKSDSGFTINGRRVSEAEFYEAVLKRAPPPEQEREPTPEEQAERQRLVAVARKQAAAIAAERRAERQKKERETYGRSFQDYEEKDLSKVYESVENVERFRNAHNKLRQARDLPPIREPVEKWRPKPKPRMQPSDPNDAPEAVAAPFERFGAEDPEAIIGVFKAEDPVVLWKMIKRLANERAHDQLDTHEPKKTRKELNKEMRYRDITKFYSVAISESGWPRKRIIDEAMRRFGVGSSTVEEAIRQYRKEFHFTDGSKLTPAK